MWEKIIIITIKSAISSNASMSRILAAAEHHHSTAGAAAVQLAVGLQGQGKRPEVTAGEAQTC